MQVTVEPAGPGDSTALRALMEFYRYDFSEFDGADVDDDGHYGYAYLDAYETDADRHAFLFRVDGALAGFALVRTIDPMELAEFFVMKKYRRRGVGREAARGILRSFPGPWRLTQLVSNPAATAFWRRVIPAEHHERVLDGRTVEHRFTVV